MSRQSPFDPFSCFDEDDSLEQRRQGSSHENTMTPSTTTLGTQKRPARAVEEDVGPRPLPPRLNVRLALHEEVAATAVADPGGESGSLSQISVEGKVTARVESPNADGNTPFCLQISGPMVTMANIACGDHCVLEEGEESTLNTSFSRGDMGAVQCRVDVPKSKGAVWGGVLSYSMNVQTQNIPILVQTRVTLNEKICRISVQIRSNLSNKGDLSDLVIILAIPMTLKGETVNVIRGENGAWDPNKRLLMWMVGSLGYGESCLVSAEAEITAAVAEVLRDNPFNPEVAQGKIQCPVLVRCSSMADQVSDLKLSVKALEGVPATIVQNQSRSYRLIHRVGDAGGDGRVVEPISTRPTSLSTLSARSLRSPTSSSVRSAK